MLEQLSNETNRWPPNTKINNQSDWVKTMDTLCFSLPIFTFHHLLSFIFPKKRKIFFKRKRNLVLYLNDKPLACWLKHSAAVSHRADRKQDTFFDCCVCVCVCFASFFTVLFASFACEPQQDDDECWFCSTWHSQRYGWQNRKYYHFSLAFTTILWIFFGRSAKTKTTSLSIHSVKKIYIFLFFTFDFS